MGKRFYKHLCKNYQLYSFVANMLNALSMAGLALLGLLTDTMTITWLVGWGIMFAVLFFIGKLLNEEIDDLDKVKEHTHESNTYDVEK
jgi:hypothetical protein